MFIIYAELGVLFLICIEWANKADKKSPEQARGRGLPISTSHLHFSVALA